MPLFAEAVALGADLRPMTDADLPFTLTLYASTRAEEVAQTGWPEAMQHAFLAQQHAAQHAHYQQHYQGMEWLIVERGGVRLGRLYLYQTTLELRIVDISLLPEARGQGLGGAILRDLLARGGRVSIHVERNNPARSLYARLGFEPKPAQGGVYDLWEWPGVES